MNIQWNSVTWYSKLIALILFIALPFIGFYLGMLYQENTSSTKTVTYTKVVKVATSSAKTATASATPSSPEPY